jgi:inorganic pyrophosphatase
MKANLRIETKGTAFLQIKYFHTNYTGLFLLAIALWLGACSKRADIIDYDTIPATTANGINVVVEIPAGTNHKIEYNKEQKKFINDQKEGKDRIIKFLPYPGNYGYIPSTLMDKARGGDGDAVDVILLSESLPTGTVVEALPIAALELLDEGEADTKIVAIPIDSSLQIIPASDFITFSINYDGAKHIIENWFLYYDGLGTNKFKAWKDEKYAMKLIKSWSK